MQVVAAEFVGRILNQITEKLHYFGGETDDVEQNHLIALIRISSHIDRLQRNGTKGQYLEKHYSNLNQCLRYASGSAEITSPYNRDRIRSGILDLIWRLRECVDFLEQNIGNPERLNQIYIQEGRINSGRMNADYHEYTGGHRWDYYLHEWRYGLQQWTDHLNLFDSVYPAIVFHYKDLLKAIAFNYRKEFWLEFWKTMIDAKQNPDSAIISGFQEFLINEIVQELISNHRGSVGESARIFQSIINTYKATPNYEAFFDRITSDEGMRRALIATEIILVPNPDLLQNSTREIVRNTWDDAAVFW
jgi:hypothetical protein